MLRLSRQNGDFKRSIVSALVALVAAVVPSLVSSPALAEKATDAPAADAKAPKAQAKSTTKKVRVKKASPSQDAAAKDAPQKPEEAKAHAKDPASAKSTAKGKKTKKTASRATAKGKKTAKKADTDAPGRRCTPTTIAIDRSGLEAQVLPIVDCHDKPIDASIDALSVLARPWGAPKPAHLAHPAPALHKDPKRAKVDPRAPLTGSAPAPVDLAPSVRRLDPGLLVRLAAIAKHFPGKPLSMVSGYRPQSRGSLHQRGRALDLRVPGVSNEELVAFCKTLRDTGCGYYPNSSFVHVDVRDPRTGSVTWIDSSGPGEAPHYVTQWPPPADQSDTAVLPPEHGPQDPWARDPGDEHTSGRDDQPASTSDEP